VTGSDLIVTAPWIIFAAALAAVTVRALRTRDAARRPRPQRPGWPYTQRRRTSGQRERADDEEDKPGESQLPAYTATNASGSPVPLQVVPSVVWLVIQPG
jgi:hypothetical protein